MAKMPKQRHSEMDKTEKKRVESKCLQNDLRQNGQHSKKQQPTRKKIDWTTPKTIAGQLAINITEADAKNLDLNKRFTFEKKKKYI